MEPHAMIQVYISLQLCRTVVENFVPGNFGLFRRNPWQPLSEPMVPRNPVEKHWSKPNKRSSHDRTLAETLKILQCVDENPRMIKSIAVHFSMKPQIVNELTKNSDKPRFQSK